MVTSLDIQGLCLHSGRYHFMPPEQGKDFGELIVQTAARKLRAGQVRFSDKAPSNEVPGDVYLSACSAIGEALSTEGYRYAKSGPKLSRKSSGFQFVISFQSSHHNVAGELVALWIHAYVVCPTLATWRNAHPSLSKSDWVAGGQIGNLLDRHSSMEWNLALPATRDEQIADAIDTIKRIVFPYFAMFDDIPSLLTRLAKESVSSFPPASVLDFIMCFGSPSTAAQAAANMLRSLPEAEQGYQLALARFRSEGLPPYTLTIHGEVLAAATLAFDLPDLTTIATR